MVVVGHWTVTNIVVVDGAPVGQSALATVGYTRWLTLLLQVMPMFFLAGGYAAAASWPSWLARGGGWPGWAHGRLVRLLRPTSWFVGIMAGLAAIAELLGLDAAVLAQAGWGVALQLWFLPVYLLLLLLAVPMIGAWARAGWLVVAAAVAIVAAVDLLMRVGHVTVAAWVSYLVVPAAGLVLGIAWHAGALARRAIPWAMLSGGALALLILVAAFHYPPWMIGVPGEPVSNTAPPNLALVAYASVQIGAVLLVEPLLRNWLDRPRVWAGVVWGNSLMMTLYLWHMVPVIIIGGLAYYADLLPGPRAGTLAWWGLRLVWVGALALMLAVVVRIVGRFEASGTPRPNLAGWVAGALLVLATILTGYALFRFAQGGFAPAGHLAVGVLAVYATGVLALWLAGRAGTAKPNTPTTAA